MNTKTTPPVSQDRRKPRALKPYLALWACLAVCVMLALSAIVLQP